MDKSSSREQLNNRLPVTKALLETELYRIRGLILEAKNRKRGTDILNIDEAADIITKALKTVVHLPTKKQ
jgi:hypothetical protein